MPRRKQSATVDLKVRMKEPLRASLEKAAKRRGVSLNAEAAARLERSFHNQALLHEILDLAYGKELAGVLMWFGRAMHDAGQFQAINDTHNSQIARNYLHLPSAREQALNAAEYVIEALRPPKDSLTEKQLKSDMGWGIADSTADAIAKRIDPISDSEDWAAPIRERLGGSLVNQIKDMKSSRSKEPKK